MRAVALDVHRDFCEVAIVAEGRLRSAGRIKTRPEELDAFNRRALAVEEQIYRGRDAIEGMWREVLKDVRDFRAGRA